MTSLVQDQQAQPRHRIDASFELAYLLQAQGRFREAARLFEPVGAALRAEKIREASSLALRALSLMESGDWRGARSLIDAAIVRSPGVPTRYLFVRGLLELREGAVTAVRTTAAKILEGALPEGNPIVLRTRPRRT